MAGPIHSSVYGLNGMPLRVRKALEGLPIRNLVGSTCSANPFMKDVQNLTVSERLLFDVSVSEVDNDARYECRRVQFTSQLIYRVCLNIEGRYSVGGSAWSFRTCVSCQVEYSLYTLDTRLTY
jgi:hypothetical protein